MRDCNAKAARDARPQFCLDDPAPVISAGSGSGWLLTVEHAGRAVPLVSRLSRAAAGSDLPPYRLGSRRAGVGGGACGRLDATLIAQRYSRLVIDCNRPWDAPDLAPAISDGTPVLVNEGLTEADLRRRWDAIHAPFHAAVADAAARARGLLAVHTYDRQRRSDGAVRPWPVGLLWRQPNPLAETLAFGLAREAAALPLGLNQPYEIEDASD